MKQIPKKGHLPTPVMVIFMDFPIKNGDFAIEIVDFPIKNGDFAIEIMDFPWFLPDPQADGSRSPGSLHLGSWHLTEGFWFS